MRQEWLLPWPLPDRSRLAALRTSTPSRRMRRQEARRRLPVCRGRPSSSVPVEVSISSISTIRTSSPRDCRTPTKMAHLHPVEWLWGRPILAMRPHMHSLPWHSQVTSSTLPTATDCGALNSRTPIWRQLCRRRPVIVSGANQYRGCGRFCGHQPNPHEHPGQTRQFFHFQWAFGAAAVVGMTYFLDPSWFLDLNCTVGTTSNPKTNIYAPFYNPSSPIAYAGNLIGNFSGTAIAQSMAVSINKSFLPRAARDSKEAVAFKSREAVLPRC